MTVTAALIALLPLAVLVASLLAGRYPGEGALARARVSLARRWPRSPAARRSTAVTHRSSPLARGGDLIGWAFGRRAPPRRGQAIDLVLTKGDDMKLRIIGLAMATVLAVPAVANAHVTLQPDEVPAGGFARLDVRVPNERDDAATEKVEVEMPDGFIFVSTEPVSGWSADVKMEKLDQPIEEHGEEITEQVRTVTFTATDPRAAIQPGQFRDFGMSVGMPSDAVEGDTLTFPALQTYESGEVVRWIGPPDSEEPAAEVTLTAPEEEAAADEEASEESSDDDDGAPIGLAIAALVVGGLGLLAGGASLVRARS
jgi:uncharacterized protein YcnI